MEERVGGGSPRRNNGTTEGKGEWHDINRLEGTVWNRGKNGGSTIKSDTLNYKKERCETCGYPYL